MSPLFKHVSPEQIRGLSIAGQYAAVSEFNVFDDGTYTATQIDPETGSAVGRMYGFLSQIDYVLTN